MESISPTKSDGGGGSHKYHPLLRMQCVQNVYVYLDEIEQIKMQGLNRRHY